MYIGNQYEPQGSIQSVDQAAKTSSPDSEVHKTDQSRIGDQKHHFIKPATFDGTHVVPGHHGVTLNHTLKFVQS